MLFIILVISLKGSKTATFWFYHFCCVNLGIYLAIRYSVSFALYYVCVCVCVCVYIHAYIYVGLPWWLSHRESTPTVRGVVKELDMT